MLNKLFGPRRTQVRKAATTPRSFYYPQLAVVMALALFLTLSMNALAADTPATPALTPVTNVPPAVDFKNPAQFRYYDATGHGLSGAILRYYDATGGLARHGLPLSEIVIKQHKYVQYFERSVLEFYPQYIGTEQEVKLLPLGAQVAETQNFGPVGAFEDTPDRWYFPETGHSLSYGFLAYWRNNGDRRTLGLPLSEEFSEAQPNGSKFTVQYFEYVKLEYHPELAGTDFAIELSLLGDEQAAANLTPFERKALPVAKLIENRSRRVPSLMFHYVRTVDRKADPLGYDLSIAPEKFVQYLDWIQQNGYQTITAANLTDYIKYGVQLPEKVVQLRFDDGYASMWLAYQEMKKRDMTATFFVVTRRLQLLPQQWQQIDQDGFEVAAHTRNHLDLRGVKDLADEITGSKTDLEAMLGHPVRTFAYPFGKFNDGIIKVVQSSGFEVACSTIGGYTWSGSTMYQQPTVSVVGDDSVASFAGKIKSGGN